MASASHRWPRLTTTDPRYGRICACGDLKTDQALTCAECAARRRRAADYDARLTCPRCSGMKSKRAAVCRRCANALQTGVAGVGHAQPADHPWRSRRP